MHCRNWTPVTARGLFGPGFQQAGRCGPAACLLGHAATVAMGTPQATRKCRDSDWAPSSAAARAATSTPPGFRLLPYGGSNRHTAESHFRDLAIIKRPKSAAALRSAPARHCMACPSSLRLQSLPVRGGRAHGCTHGWPGTCLALAASSIVFCMSLDVRSIRPAARSSTRP